jgi:hypothetical protein
MDTLGYDALPIRLRRSPGEWLRMVGRGIVGAFAILGAILAYPFLGRRWARWGARPEEAVERIDGESPAQPPVDLYVRGIDIAAPAARVWPWLLQIGQNRGGFFSYELLENLVGCRIHNLDHLEPSLQHLQVGDLIKFHASAEPLKITAIAPGRLLEIGGWWTFLLRPVDENRTRLVIRTRIPRPAGPGTRFFVHALLGPIHFVMERRMLLEIRRLSVLP